MPTVTFALDASEVARVLAALAGIGVVFDRPRAVTTTVLDTFDGRVHRAGLRLEVDESTGLELVLTGPDAVPARLAIASSPSTPGDLPHGPMRSRLERLTDVRTLQPQITTSALRRAGTWRNDDGKAVAVVIHDEHGRVVAPQESDAVATTVEVHEVTGYPKRARRLVDLLVAHGLTRWHDDALALRALAVGVDLAGFRASATVPLDPRAPALEAYRAVLANLARTIDANRQGTLDRTDTEFLHDLRVALRRTRTVLGAAKGVLPPDVRGPAREGFAWLARLTGPARDLDVYLLEWDSYVAPLAPDVAAALGPVRTLLVRRADDAHQALEHALRSARAIELLGHWTHWLEEPAAGTGLGDRAGCPIGTVAAKRIRRAHAVVLDAGRRIDPTTSAEQVHALRKDAKRLRYLIECFGSLLPDTERKRFVKRLKTLQDNLGAHQDTVVHAAMLRGVAHDLHDAGASADTMVAIGQLTERLDRQRLDARTDFHDTFANYDTAATQRALDAMLAATER